MEKKNIMDLARNVSGYISLFMLPFELIAKLLIIVVAFYVYSDIGGEINYWIVILMFISFISRPIFQAMSYEEEEE